MNINKLTIPALLVPALLVGAWQLDSRYAKQSDLVLVEIGHERAEKTAMLYTATREWADIVGREAMYRAQAESDPPTITESGRARWETMKLTLANAKNEMDRLTKEIEDL